MHMHVETFVTSHHEHFKHPTASQAQVDYVQSVYVALSAAHMLQVIYLQLTCDWMFKLLAMASQKSFNILNILLTIL